MRSIRIAEQSLRTVRLSSNEAHLARQRVRQVGSVPGEPTDAATQLARDKVSLTLFQDPDTLGGDAPRVFFFSQILNVKLGSHKHPKVGHCEPNRATRPSPSFVGEHSPGSPTSSSRGEIAPSQTLRRDRVTRATVGLTRMNDPFCAPCLSEQPSFAHTARNAAWRKPWASCELASKEKMQKCGDAVR